MITTHLQKRSLSKKKMKYNKNILTVEEQTIINQSVKDAENELNKWFET